MINWRGTNMSDLKYGLFIDGILFASAINLFIGAVFIPHCGETRLICP